MAVHDAIRKHRPSRANAVAPTGLHYVPIVRSRVIDEDAWQSLGALSLVPAAPGALRDEDALPVPEADDEGSATATQAMKETMIVERAQGAAHRGPPPIPPEALRTHASAPSLQDEVRALLAAGRSFEAHEKVEAACRTFPDHEAARALALKVCLELDHERDAVRHAEWLLERCATEKRSAEACAVYRSVHARVPDATFGERSLLVLLIVADSERDGLLVAEATRKLLRLYPQSTNLPGALLKTAEYQLALGQRDLARATFTHVVSAYPESVCAEVALRMLRTLTQP